MNINNYRNQKASGRALLVITYPLAIGIHFVEWRRMRKLRHLIRSWISYACKHPDTVMAGKVSEWSDELHTVYGK